MTAEAVQRDAVQLIDPLQHFHVAVARTHIQAMGDRAELQIEVKQQGAATIGAEAVGEVAGQHGCTRTALGIHDRDDLATAPVTVTSFQRDPADGGQQLLLHQRLRQEVTGTGLHRHTHAVAVVLRAADQQRRPLLERVLLQRSEFLAPQVADV